MVVVVVVLKRLKGEIDKTKSESSSNTSLPCVFFPNVSINLITVHWSLVLCSSRNEMMSMSLTTICKIVLYSLVFIFEKLSIIYYLQTQAAKKGKEVKDPVQVDLAKFRHHTNTHPNIMPFLPCAGTITQLKQKDCVFVTSLFGVDFFCQKGGHDLMANVLVPAWYCKTVTRDDQAFCLAETRIFTAYLIVRKSVRARDERGTTLRLSWDPPQDEPYVEIPIVTW